MEVEKPDAGNSKNDKLSRLVEKSVRQSNGGKAKPLRNGKVQKPKLKCQEIAPRYLHYDDLREALEAIKNSAIEDHFSVSEKDLQEASYEPYINLGNSCRNAMVKILKCSRDDIHCTIKYCSGKKRQAKKYRKLWTFARSREVSGRQITLGPKHKIRIYKNSSFSAIVGCKDKAGNVWPYRRNQCFSCNNLTIRKKYADSKVDWETFYKSVCVFPLRYELEHQNRSGLFIEERIMGFLTFDSPTIGVFTDVPSRFDHLDNPDRYLKLLRNTDIYHIGMALANAITAVSKLAGQLAEKDLIRNR